MTLTDSNIRALESHARRSPDGALIQFTRDEALSLLVEVRRLRAEMAKFQAQRDPTKERSDG